MGNYEVVVGNIGTVYSGHRKSQAVAKYDTYVELAKLDSGRAAGESVVLFEDGQIIAEHESASQD